MLSRRLATASLLCAPGLRAAPRELLMPVALLPPYVLDAGHPAGDGIDIDITRAALALVGSYRLRVERLPWRRVLAQLEAGDADLTAAARDTPERRRFLSFSRGYGATVQHDFYALRERGALVRRLEDLRGLRVGVVAGFAFPPALQAGLGSDTEQALNLPILLRMVAAQRIDVAVVNSLPGRWLVQELGLAQRLARQSYSHDSGDQTRLAVSLRRTGSAQLLAELDRGLALLARQGPWSRFEAPYLRPLPGPAALRRAGGGGSA
jgi:polar amino acid transport system substrate-binding protein